MMALRTIAAAVFVLAAGAAFAEPVPPVDEGAGNPSFAAFRERLIAIVEARDFAALEPLIHPDIRISFGTGGGRADALAEFRRDPSRWDELGELLALGGKFDETGRFVAPYTFWVEVDDPYTTAVVIGSKVNVRAEPSTNSAVLAQLTHETVLLAENAFGAGGWLRVALPDRRQGYISEDFVRLILDYRAGWTLIEGEWLMDLFLAGD